MADQISFPKELVAGLASGVLVHANNVYDDDNTQMLDATIDGIKTDISTVSEDVAAVQTTANAAKTTATSAQTQANTNKTNIASLTTKVNTNTTNIATNAAAITSLKSNVSDLVADYFKDLGTFSKSAEGEAELASYENTFGATAVFFTYKVNGSPSQSAFSFQTIRNNVAYQVLFLGGAWYHRTVTVNDDKTTTAASWTSGIS